MGISKFIFICKKKLINWIEKIPVQRGAKINEDRKAFTGMVLEICGHLIRGLPIKENSLGGIVGYSRSDPKAYYLYMVISEVLSSSLSYMRAESDIKESEDELKFGYPKVGPGNETISSKRIFHLMHDSIMDDFEVKFRKLQEHLCNLISFSETKDQKYFRLFLASHALADIKFANQDIKEFFGKPLENFNFQSADLLNLCETLFNDVDDNKCWFLKDNIKFNVALKPNQILSSFRQRYKKGIKIAHDGEKVVLGPTYKVGYGGSSKSAHGLIKDHYKDHTLEDIKHKIIKIPLICMNILCRVSEIAEIECSEKHKIILDGSKSGEGLKESIFSLTKGNYDVGDLVTTDGSDVAEILTIHESSYSYKCYLVRYLINPKLKEITEEWLPPKYIGPILLKKESIREFCLQNVLPLLGEEGLSSIESKNDAELYDYAKEALLHMAKEGHLKLLFENRSKQSV